MSEKKLAYIALAGEPNAGKSTLLNSLTGEKISIVTPKVQTSRRNVRGVVNYEDTQIVFIDTPGLLDPKSKMEHLILNNAKNGISQADFLCVLFDVNRNNFERTVSLLKQTKLPKHKIAILNKIDLLQRQELLEIAKRINELEHFDHLFMISALKGDGIQDIIKYFAKLAPKSDWEFNEDELTDLSIREIAEEITREKLYLNLNKELPYSLKVETDKWEDLPSGGAKIYQSVYVLKPSHKKIILGEKGNKVKAISISARKAISNLLKQPAHLFLHIKIREDWLDKQKTF